MKAQPHTLSTGSAFQVGAQRHITSRSLHAIDPIDPRQQILHALFIRDPEAYGLPTNHLTTNYIIAKEDYYFVYPTNYHRYLNLYKDSMQHGGASMEEMILPVITMRPKR